MTKIYCSKKKEKNCNDKQIVKKEVIKKIKK